MYNIQQDNMYYDTQNLKSNHKDSLPQEVSKSFNQGIGSFYKGIGGALNWIGEDKHDGDKWKQKGERIIQNNRFTDPITEEFNFGQLGDINFWTQKVPALIPNMVGFGATAVVGGAAGGVAGTALGASKGLSYLLGAFGAGISARTSESLIEGGQAFEEAKLQGFNDIQAGEIGQKVFNKNMLLAVGDITQFALTFAPIKGLKALKIAGNTAVEGLEEVYQEYIAADTLSIANGSGGVDIVSFLQKPSTKEAFALGGIMGGIFGSVGAVTDITKILNNQHKELITAVENKDDTFLTKVELLVSKKELSSKYAKELRKSFNTLSELHATLSPEEWKQQISTKNNKAFIGTRPTIGGKKRLAGDKSIVYKISLDGLKYKHPTVSTHGRGALGNIFKLEDILEVPDLFKHYPELRQLEIHYKGGGRRNTTLGSYVRGRRNGKETSWIELRGRNKNNALTTLVHEVQHGVQHKDNRLPTNRWAGKLGYLDYLRQIHEHEAREIQAELIDGASVELQVPQSAIEAYVRLNREGKLPNTGTKKEQNSIIKYIQKHLPEEVEKYEYKNASSNMKNSMDIKSNLDIFKEAKEKVDKMSKKEKEKYLEDTKMYSEEAIIEAVENKERVDGNFSFPNKGEGGYLIDSEDIVYFENYTLSETKNISVDIKSSYLKQREVLQTRELIEQSIQPTQPTQPIQPIQPTQPTQPTQEKLKQVLKGEGVVAKEYFKHRKLYVYLNEELEIFIYDKSKNEGKQIFLNEIQAQELVESLEGDVNMELIHKVLLTLGHNIYAYGND